MQKFKENQFSVNSVIYVCGGGASREPDVKRTLTALYAEEKEASLDIAENWMTQMAKDGR